MNIFIGKDLEFTTFDPVNRVMCITVYLQCKEGDLMSDDIKKKVKDKVFKAMYYLKTEGFIVDKDPNKWRLEVKGIAIQ